MKCEHCNKPLTKEDDYIKYEDDRYCSWCYSGYTSTFYTVGGEPLASDDDGVEEFGHWNEEEVEE